MKKIIYASLAIMLGASCIDESRGAENVPYAEDYTNLSLSSAILPSLSGSENSDDNNLSIATRHAKTMLLTDDQAVSAAAANDRANCIDKSGGAADVPPATALENIRAGFTAAQQSLAQDPSQNVPSVIYKNLPSSHFRSLLEIVANRPLAESHFTSMMRSLREVNLTAAMDYFNQLELCLSQNVTSPSSDSGEAPRSPAADSTILLSTESVASDSDEDKGDDWGDLVFSDISSRSTEYHKLTLHELGFLRRVVDADNTQYASLAQGILLNEAERNRNKILPIDQARLEVIKAAYAASLSQNAPSSSTEPKEDDDDIVYPSAVQSPEVATAAAAAETDDDQQAHQKALFRQPVTRRDEFGNVQDYDSITEAAKALFGERLARGEEGLNPNEETREQRICTIIKGIQNAACGRQETSYGFSWRYTDGKGPNSYGLLLKDERPDLFAQIDLEKNAKELRGEGLDKLISGQLTLGSKVKVWWKCPKGHESYRTDVHNRTNGEGCPKCANKNKGPNKPKSVILEALDKRGEGKRFLASKENEIAAAIERGIVSRDTQGRLHFKSLTDVKRVLGIPVDTVRSAGYRKDGIMRGRGLKVTLAEADNEADSSRSAAVTSGQASKRPRPASEETISHPKKRLSRVESSSSSSSAKNEHASSSNRLSSESESEKANRPHRKKLRHAEPSSSDESDYSSSSGGESDYSSSSSSSSESESEKASRPHRKRLRRAEPSSSDESDYSSSSSSSSESESEKANRPHRKKLRRAEPSSSDESDYSSSSSSSSESESEKANRPHMEKTKTC